MSGCGISQADKNNKIKGEEIKNQVSVKNENAIKNSKDNKDYSIDGKVNISTGEGKQNEMLYIITKELQPSEISNKPKEITLKIKNSQVNLRSIWNDGIIVSTEDFDKSDRNADIYITVLGTDIQTTTYIYTFDGNQIQPYGEIKHLGKDFLYNESGKIYYSNGDSEKREFDTYYDYKTKVSSKITDEKLKTALNKN
jgi:hypothetical protein